MTEHASDGLASKAMLRTAQLAPLLTSERENRLARRAQGGDQAAFDELVASHLRLVLAIAHEHASFGLPLEDLVSEGSLGLVEATRRFDPERGVRLAVYAAWWIRAYMRKHTVANRRIVRPPSTRHGRKLLSNLRKTERALEVREGHAPDAEAVAKELGVTAREVEEMHAALTARDVPCGGVDDEGRGTELRDRGPSPETEAETREEDRAHRAALNQALEQLSPRERRIVQLRFFGDEMTSLASIGRDMGLSRERVRQLARQAEGKMRQTVMASVA